MRLMTLAPVAAVALLALAGCQTQNPDEIAQLRSEVAAARAAADEANRAASAAAADAARAAADAQLAGEKADRIFREGLRK
ncbi:MAG TPA: alanine-zipper protein [Geminicoccaceae bacterium]|nr:alanine-zipper protein [Geminicoccaceae bacterium]